MDNPASVLRLLHLVYELTRGTRQTIERIEISTGETETLTVSPYPIYPVDAYDDQFVLVELSTPSGAEIHTLDTSSGKTTPIFDSEFDRRNGDLSPDGSWLAYTSNETGEWEVFVTSFPAADRKIRISPNGGEWPLWSPDGTKLYFRESDEILVVNVQSEPDFSISRAEAILSDIEFGFAQVDDRRNERLYDLAPDGTRFLIPKPAAPASSSDEIVVVENWFDDIRFVDPVDTQ